MSDTRPNLLDFDPQGLAKFCTDIGEKPFRARQLTQWIHQRGVIDFDAMTDLSKAFRARLPELAEIRLPEIQLAQQSQDGTRKWLLQMDCGNAVETVYIPDGRRGTLCISSQVGCSLNCSFCSTGAQGFNRNLSVAEIIGQFWIAQASFGHPEKLDRVITNVVLMGMGEPLMNYDNVMTATRLMTDDLAYGLSKRRVTLSTAGLVPMMDKLKDDSDISLAVSLHAPNDELRNQLVPLNKKYDIKQLMAACRRFIATQPGRQITFEYVMLDGINDRLEHAKQLVKVLGDIPAKVNLIPFNPFPGSHYKRSPSARINRFRDVLTQARLVCVTRKTRGDDIDAACGQLVGEFDDRTRRREKLAPTAHPAP